METAIAVRIPVLERIPVQTFLQRHAVRPASDEEYLLSMLHEHEVDVYDPVEVSRHMQHRESREYIKARTAIRRQAFWPLTAVKALLIMVPLLLVAISFALGSAEWLWGGVAVGFCLMMFCWATCESLATWVASVRVAWEDTVIGPGSNIEMPVRVKELLTHLRSTSPKLGFHVSELKVYKDNRPELFDPILVVSYGEAQFHVAVWDEPGFYAPLIG